MHRACSTRNGMNENKIKNKYSVRELSREATTEVSSLVLTDVTSCLRSREYAKLPKSRELEGVKDELRFL